MAKKASFIERMRPLKERSRLIDWPFPVEGGDVPKVRVKILTQDDMETAHFAAIEHFKDHRPKVGTSDPAFLAREHTELAWLAFEDPESGEPIAESAQDLADLSAEVVDPLYEAWNRFQAETTVRPLDQKQMNELVEHLKKNTDAAPLRAFPSSWLIGLITTLVSQLPDSTLSSKPG